MHDTLTKPWASHEAGTAITDNPAEAAELGAVEVPPVRFAYLRTNGFFKAAPAILRREPSAAPVASSAPAPEVPVAAAEQPADTASPDGRA